MVFLDGEAKVKAKFTDTNVFPSPFTVEVTKTTLPFFLGSIKFIFVINILNASVHAMHLAIEKLKIKPEYILVDGNRFSPFRKIPYKCIIRGDGKYQNIAAASILAKTYRDEYMEKIGQSFPEYKWNNNKGYPTHKHRAAIKKYGPTQHHRKSFKLLPNQTNIIFK